MLHVQVDCSEMPEDMVSAQDFMEENINCHNVMAPGPRGKALVVIFIPHAMHLALTVYCDTPPALPEPTVQHQWPTHR